MTEIRQPVAGLYTAGQPDPAELAALARAGVFTIINLRAPGESMDFDEIDVARRLGLRYVAIPVAGEPDVTEDTVRRFSGELARARNEGGVLVHCASGNRVGALLALDLGLTQGAPREEALALGRAAGLLSLEPAVAAMLDRR